VTPSRFPFPFPFHFNFNFMSTWIHYFHLSNHNLLHWYDFLLTHASSYKIGDSFFQLPLADAQAMLETSTAQIDTDVSKLEDSLGELRDELQQLKVSLYARFGRSINLET
jgi:hypothetical protein